MEAVRAFKVFFRMFKTGHILFLAKGLLVANKPNYPATIITSPVKLDGQGLLIFCIIRSKIKVSDHLQQNIFQLSYDAYLWTGHCLSLFIDQHQHFSTIRAKVMSTCVTQNCTFFNHCYVITLKFGIGEFRNRSNVYEISLKSEGVKNSLACSWLISCGMTHMLNSSFRQS